MVPLGGGTFAQGRLRRVIMPNPVVSIVTAAYQEAANLPLVYERLTKVLDAGHENWEWVVVDDHSSDGTFDAIRRIAAVDRRVRGIRLARNVGSHLAMKCGLDASLGQCAIILAGDLQDPPETIPALLEKWRAGAQVVWAVRAGREGASASTLLFASLYYWMMTRLIGLKSMPAKGADFFLADRRVLDALRQVREVNVSILGLIFWMGFRQDRIEVVRQVREHGASSWNLRKKLKLVADSVTSFSHLPIRLISYLGLCVTLCGLFYAAGVIVRHSSGRPIAEWNVLLIVVLALGGLQTLLMGILGEYVWRTLDETRRRPHVLVEDTIGAFAGARPDAPGY